MKVTDKKITDQVAERLLSGRAWDDFCETLRKTGQMIEAFGDEISDLDRAEWYRFLTRFVRMGFERYVEGSEPTRPLFREFAWRQGIIVTCPLQDHLWADFYDSGADYVIEGNRGTLPHFVIASLKFDAPADFAARDWAALGQDGLKQFDPSKHTTQASIESSEIHFDNRGNFRVIASQKRPEEGQDWLPLAPVNGLLLVRGVYKQREGTVPATMRLARLDQARPRPIDPAYMGEALTKAGQATLAYAELMRSWWQGNLGKRPNSITFSPGLYMSVGGVQDDRYLGFGAWQCAKDEALVVKFTPIPCEFWSFQFCNIWQENFDNYEEGQGYLYKAGTRLEEDGSVLMIVADEDPGCGGHWIDPYGHTHGVWGFRMIKNHGNLPPPLFTWKVKLADLKRDGLAILKAQEAVVSGQVVG